MRSLLDLIQRLTDTLILLSMKDYLLSKIFSEVKKFLVINLLAFQMRQIDSVPNSISMQIDL